MASNSTLLTTALIGVLLLAGSAAHAKGPSGVYCIKHKAGLETFVFRSLRHGRIQFGLTLYDEREYAMHVYGVAVPEGNGAWTYRSQMNDAEARCIVRIRRTPTAMIVVGDDRAPCKLNGGVGTSVGYHRFSNRYFEKPVTWEFRDEETALERSGRCWRK